MLDPVKLEIFKHLFSSLAEEMGVMLCRSAYSPNIKERRDFSCALFDKDGKMVAQAAHLPVHLGAMPLSLHACLNKLEISKGDIAILNDPRHGGSHLPDITMITPIFAGQHLLGFAANRAHHSDVGGMSPGSMPLSQELYQEGVIIPPVKLAEDGHFNQGVMDLLMANVRTPLERAGDVRAQIAANRKGIHRANDLVTRYGLDEICSAMQDLLEYSEIMTRRMITEMPDGNYKFQDVMDNDGIDSEKVTIAVEITIDGDEAIVDFSGSSSQQRGSINTTYSVTTAATMYAFRCLMRADIPSNSGCLVPIRTIIPQGTVVNSMHPAAVSAGNVETSQRITDVLLGALSQVCPERVPAASQGTMNNLTIGGIDPRKCPPRPFTYYETIAGGMGARPSKDGADAIHTHMTNTLNTPVEALEYEFPVQVRRYAIRRGSGGAGLYWGGNGIVREIKLLTEATVVIISDRRQSTPYGLSGGNPGKPGHNVILRNGQEQELSGKVRLDAQTGDIIIIHTPGGGGWGHET